MNILLSKYKKPIFILLFIAAIIAIIVLSLFNKNEATKNTTVNQETGNQNTTGNSDNNLTISPLPTRVLVFTGADEAAEDKYLKEHPELFTEARLQEQVPIEYNNFTLDYSYDEDKFLVKLKPPYEQSKDVFNNWMKQLGLPDKNRFIITELK